jgi:pyruvate/2-oxoglutarate dehydrogenase complex dihydrolipoamide dehydrogenase (E3) component
MQNYDAIVIGSGQGGSPMAHKLADLGQKVALIEREHLGGSCINYGCTPTKTMVASARVAHYARRGPEYGVNTGEVSIDFAKVIARKNEMVLQWRQGQQNHVDRRPTLDLVRGHARFTGSHEIEVNGESLTSEKIFIDTGTRARILPIPGLDEVPYLTNKEILDLETLPEHLLVLGGNYLGLEFGQMFRRFGSRVSVVEVNDRIASREDEEVSDTLLQILQEEGIDFYLGHKTTRVAKSPSTHRPGSGQAGSGRTGDSIELTIEGKDGGTQTLSGTHLLVAVGRAPNTEDLGLEAAGIETDQHGIVKTNGRLETNVPGVWAIGDVKGGPAFTHVSYDDHLVIWDNLIEGKDRSVDGRIVPYSMFTDPELGGVGMTEREARAAGYKLKVGSMPMAWVARAIERGETKGMAKVVINAENDRILGATYLGPEGGDLVQTLMTLMLADAPWTVFKQRMFTHPTMTEGFFTLMDQVKDA